MRHGSRAQLTSSNEPDRRDQLQRFYKANRNALYSYAMSITNHGPAAEDAVQAAILKVLNRGRLPKSLRPYVFRAVRNAAIDGWRRDRAVQVNTEEPPVEATGDQDQLSKRLVRECLACISKNERETIVLRIVAGFTLQEIASMRRRSANTVAAWYRRGLAKLRSMLEEEP